MVLVLDARAGQAGGNGLALSPFALPPPCPAASSGQGRGNEKFLPPCRGTLKKTGQGLSSLSHMYIFCRTTFY